MRSCEMGEKKPAQGGLVVRCWVQQRVSGQAPCMPWRARHALVRSMGLGGLQGFHLLRRPWSHGLLLMAPIGQGCAVHAVVSKSCGANPQHHH